MASKTSGAYPAPEEEKTVTGVIGMWGYTLKEGVLDRQFRVLEMLEGRVAVQTFSWADGTPSTVEFIVTDDFFDHAKTKLFAVHAAFLHALDYRARFGRRNPFNPGEEQREKARERADLVNARRAARNG